MEAEDIKSAKWFWWWVWDLDKYDLRKILSGLRFADGCEANNQDLIYTSSARFRDELMRVCLHAGYSPHFRLVYEKGTNRGQPLGRDVIAKHDNWIISYNTTVQYAEPNLRAKRDIKIVKYTGRTWCVKMPSDFIVVRRAHFDIERGVVTKASRPVIGENCHMGINRAGSLLASYLMTGGSRKYTFERAVNLLTRANSKRDYSVLTNKDFREALKRYPIYTQIKRYGSGSSRLNKNQVRAYNRYVNIYLPKKYNTRYQSRTSASNSSNRGGSKNSSSSRTSRSSSNSSSTNKRGSSSASKNPRNSMGHCAKKGHSSQKGNSGGKIIIVKKKRGSSRSIHDKKKR